jgi:hypothetical protein
VCKSSLLLYLAFCQDPPSIVTCEAQLKMSTQSTQSTHDEVDERYTLSISLPAAIRAQVSSGTTWLPDLNYVFMDERLCVRAQQGRGARYQFHLVQTGERLATRFYKCHGACNAPRAHMGRFGVLVANGPGFGSPKIITRYPPAGRPFGGFKEWRVWEGVDRGYAGAQWAIRRSTTPNDAALVRPRRRWRRRYVWSSDGMWLPAV